MFKKQLLFACVMLLCVAARAQTKYPFYYEYVRNPDSTVNFIFGFYPSSLNYYDGPESEPYTNIRSAIVNNSRIPLKWPDYKVNILLKSGKLIRSYLAFAKDGDFACNYTISTDSTHLQNYCFHEKFTSEDIDRVWLVLSDDEIFSLFYNKNEDNVNTESDSKGNENK